MSDVFDQKSIAVVAGAFALACEYVEKSDRTKQSLAVAKQFLANEVIALA